MLSEGDDDDDEDYGEDGGDVTMANTSGDVSQHEEEQRVEIGEELQCVLCHECSEASRPLGLICFSQVFFFVCVCVHYVYFCM
jgi:hypothetical protein